MSAFVIKEMLKKQTMESLREYLGIVAAAPEEDEGGGFQMLSAAPVVEKTQVVADVPVVKNANRIRRPRRIAIPK